MATVTRLDDDPEREP
jgi:hypothetical protein